MFVVGERDGVVYMLHPSLLKRVIVFVSLWEVLTCGVQD